MDELHQWCIVNIYTRFPLVWILLAQCPMMLFKLRFCKKQNSMWYYNYFIQLISPNYTISIYKDVASFISTNTPFLEYMFVICCIAFSSACIFTSDFGLLLVGSARLVFKFFPLAQFVVCDGTGFAASSAKILAKEVGCAGPAATVFPQTGAAVTASAAFLEVFCDLDLDFMVTPGGTSGGWAACVARGEVFVVFVVIDGAGKGNTVAEGADFESCSSF